MGVMLGGRGFKEEDQKYQSMPRIGCAGRPGYGENFKVYGI